MRKVLNIVLSFLLTITLSITYVENIITLNGEYYYIPMLFLFYYLIKNIKDLKFNFLPFIISVILAIINFIFFKSNNVLYNLILIISRFLLFYIVIINLYNIKNYKKTLLIFKNKRQNIVVLILSVILAIFEVLGYNLTNYSSFLDFDYNFLVLDFILNLIILYISISFLFFKLSTIKIKNIKFSKKDLKIIFIITSILFLCLFLCFYSIYFPGILSYDSILQIGMAAGDKTFTSHHPVIHTVLIKMFINIGGSVKNGVIIYSITQMIFMAISFSYLLIYLIKKQVDYRVIIFSYIYLFFSIINSLYSFTMWKDIPFALIFIFFIINIYEIIRDDKYLKSKKNCIKFCFITIMMFLFRNNGIYIFFLSLPFMIILLKKSRKQVFICSILCITVCWFINNPVLNYFDIQKGQVKEALSVPMQQIARTYKYHKRDLSKKDIKTINYYFDNNESLIARELDKLYTPRISDPVKFSFNTYKFYDNKKDFIKLWFKLLIKYPGTYISSFLYNSYGYFYPEEVYWTVHYYIDPNNYGLEIKDYDMANIKIRNINYKIRNVPVLSMFSSAGFMFWINFISFAYLIYKKNYKSLIVNILFLGLMITVMASPVYCEYRYIYSIVVCIPLILSFGFNLNKEKIKK